jgi:hypothetical protein
VTALGRVALEPCDVVLPLLEGVDGVDPELAALVGEQAAALCAPTGRHRLVEVDPAGLHAALSVSPVPLSTMGRGLDEDLAGFLAAAAAGTHAADLVG